MLQPYSFEVISQYLTFISNTKIMIFHRFALIYQPCTSHSNGYKINGELMDEILQHKSVTIEIKCNMLQF